MYQTNYVRAKDTNDAVAKLDNEAKILAGGMTLIPTMKQRLASPETLVDLADCSLAGIEDLETNSGLSDDASCRCRNIQLCGGGYPGASSASGENW